MKNTEKEIRIVFWGKFDDDYLKKRLLKIGGWRWSNQKSTKAEIISVLKEIVEQSEITYIKDW